MMEPTNEHHSREDRGSARVSRKRIFYFLSCCPERKPLDIDEWKAKADAAEAEIARLKSALLTGIGCNLNELANKGLPFEWSSMSGIGVMCRALGFSVNELTPELKAALAAEKFNPDNLARLHALKTAQPPAVGEDVVERAAIAFFDAMQKQMPESEKIKSWDDDAGDPDAEWARNAIRAGAKAALEATMLRTKDAG